MPKTIGDVGFPMTVHPRDADTAWVFPMDGTDVWPRTSPDGRPSVYVTRDAGASWQRQDRGLPANATADSPTIAKDKNEAKITVKTKGNTPVGSPALIVTGKAKVGGADLGVAAPAVTLTIKK